MHKLRTGRPELRDQAGDLGLQAERAWAGLAAGTDSLAGWVRAESGGVVAPRPFRIAESFRDPPGLEESRGVARLEAQVLLQCGARLGEVVRAERSTRARAQLRRTGARHRLWRGRTGRFHGRRCGHRGCIGPDGLPRARAHDERQRCHSRSHGTLPSAP